MKKIILFLLLSFLSFFLITNHQFLITIFTTRLATHNQAQPITLVAVGDIMLGRSVNAKMRTLDDFSYPFAKTKEFLKSADITFGNLESPLSSGCPTTDTGMVFCADPKAIEGLTQAEFDFLSLANNHILNYGQNGLNQTVEILEKNNIFPLVAGKTQTTKIKGTSFGFLAFDLTGNYQLNQIVEKTRELKNETDILIVSLHWGNEYTQKPSQKQIDIAHQIIDSGADLILGHHPHVVQPTEEYKGKLIVYSLGNFIFDQPWSEETKKGLVAKLTFQDKRLIKTEFLPIYIRDLSQPELINP